MVQVEIDVNKKYIFPQEICVVKYAEKYLIIAPEYANWIVLDSEEQLSILNYFKQGHTILETLSNSFKEDDVNCVVCQIEARCFCNKNIHNSVEDSRCLHLYLTNKCNLLCPHCYMLSGKSNENELTTEQITTLIYNYKTIAKGTRLTISGGEPTIRADFLEIVKYASELGLEIKLLTNGALLTKTIIETLSQYIRSVQISIDGFSEESNATIRGKNHFQKALDSLDNFIKNGVETSVAITPPYSILKLHLDDYVDFSERLVEKYKGKPFCVKFTEGLSKGRKINPSKLENEKYSKLIKTIQTKIYGLEYEFIHFVEIMSNDIINDNCMFGVFAVASNGDVYFCPEIGKLHPVANIKKDSFNDILQKSLAAEKATSVTQLESCRDCELRYICGGGCRIDEFPGISEIVSFEKVTPVKVMHRNCTSKIKNKFYDLMIKSNEYLYK